MGMFTRGSKEKRGELALMPLTTVPRADEPADFLGSRVFEEIPGLVFLLWKTRAGVLGAAYPTTEGNQSPAKWVLEFIPEIRCLIQVASEGFHSPDGPDVYDQAVAEGEDRQLLWRHYAYAIGRPAPYWPWHLNHRDLIEAWRPGVPAVTAVPQQETPDMTPLLRLAVLYEPASPTRRVLEHYYFKALKDAAGGSDLAWDSLGEDAFDHLATRLEIAARALPTPSPASLTDIDDQARRAVFSGLIERQDTLAVQVVDALRHWGATRHMPFVRYHRYKATDTALLAEWTARLQPVPTSLGDARFAGLNAPDPERTGRRFVDPATGAPVIEVLDFDGRVEGYATLLPRRLPSTTPLAELIIDGHGHSNWVRTTDRLLYPAPAGGYGVAWGYSGSLYAVLVQRLLNDITAEPVDKPEPRPDNGLTTLTKTLPPNGTVYTRTQLEAARDQPA